MIVEMDEQTLDHIAYKSDILRGYISSMAKRAKESGDFQLQSDICDVWGLVLDIMDDAGIWDVCIHE